MCPSIHVGSTSLGNSRLSSIFRIDGDACVRTYVRTVYVHGSRGGEIANLHCCAQAYEIVQPQRHQAAARNLTLIMTSLSILRFLTSGSTGSVRQKISIIRAATHSRTESDTDSHTGKFYAVSEVVSCKTRVRTRSRNDLCLSTPSLVKQ